MVENAEDPNTQAPVSTVIKIGDQDFDLKNMPADKGAELYQALGTLHTQTNYQQLADHVTELTYHFQSVLSITPPNGMTLSEGFKALSAAVEQAKGKAEDIADPAMKEFYAQVRGLHVMDGMLDTTEDIVTTVKWLAEFGDNFIKPLAAPTRIPEIWRASKATGHEIGNRLDTHITPEQAKAYGAAYAGAFYALTESPLSPDATKRPEPGLIDEGTAHVSSLWDKLLHNFPSVDIFLTAVGNWFHNDFHWDWDAAKAQVAKELATPALTYEQALEKHEVAKVEKQARQFSTGILTAADNIAGIPTAPLAELINKGGVYRDFDGSYKTVAFKDGQPKIDALLGKDGKPLTSGKVLLDKWMEVTHHLLPSVSSAGIGGYMGGLYVGGKFVVPAAKGALNGTVNGSKTFAQGYANSLVGDNSALAQKAEDLLEKAKKLNAQAIAERDGKTSLKIFGKDTGLFRKAPNPEAADALFEKANKLSSAADEMLTANAARTAANPRLAALANDAQEFDGIKDVAKKPLSYLAQKMGGGLGKAWNTATDYLSGMKGKATTVYKLVSNTDTEVAPASRFVSETSGRIPVVGSIIGAAPDLIQGVKALNQGDGKLAAHHTGSAVGGVMGVAASEVVVATGVATAAGFAGVEAGAGTGAAIGALFGGVGAVPGALIGMAVGGIAAWGGYKIGSKAFSQTTDDITGRSAEVHPALAAATIEATQRAQNQALGVVGPMKNSSVAMGAHIPDGSHVPPTALNTQNATPGIQMDIS